MAKKNKSRSRQRNAKYGYGIPNINKRKLTKKDMAVIFKKSWKDVTSMDLYQLYQFGFKSEDLSLKFNISIVQILNRLRFQ